MTLVQQPMDPNDAFAELGRIKLADVDIDTLLDKIAQLANGPTLRSKPARAAPCRSGFPYTTRSPAR